MRERERKKKKLSHTNILRMRGEKGTISKRKRKKIEAICMHKSTKHYKCFMSCVEQIQ